MDIKITFLGTSSSMPTSSRNHTSILLEYENESILIDCGEGTQRQFRRAHLNPCKLTRILITHLHGDHVLGLPGLLQTLAMSNYSKTLKIYGPQGLKRHITYLEQIYGRFKISLQIHETSSLVFDEKNFQVLAQAMTHNTQTNAYSFIVKNKIKIDKKKLLKYKLPNSPLIKQLQEGKDIVYNKKKIKSRDVTFMQEGKKVTFILDTSPNPKTIEIAKKSNTLVCEATYAQAEQDTAKEHMHLTTSQAATIAKKSKSSRLILTHISQRYENNLKALEKEASRIFKNTKIAQDLEQFKI